MEFWVEGFYAIGPQNMPKQPLRTGARVRLQSQIEIAVVPSALHSETTKHPKLRYFSIVHVMKYSIDDPLILW